MIIDAKNLDHRQLNEQLRNAKTEQIKVQNCLGQRYLASGMSSKEITLCGTPGNALGSYLDGCTLHVYGNAQEATGDTMNCGKIYIHGSSGDATGYAMRGGTIMVEHSVGYRAGIHMKEYQQKVPALIIGGSAGSFLGEYQAGGIIAVLNLDGASSPVGNFCGVGMHGGKIFVRSNHPPKTLSDKLCCSKASRAELAELIPLLEEFCSVFGKELGEMMDSDFYLLTPDSKNPYKQLYTPN